MFLQGFHKISKTKFCNFLWLSNYDHIQDFAALIMVSMCAVYEMASNSSHLIMLQGNWKHYFQTEDIILKLKVLPGNRKHLEIHLLSIKIYNHTRKLRKALHNTVFRVRGDMDKLFESVLLVVFKLHDITVAINQHISWENNSLLISM